MHAHVYVVLKMYRSITVLFVCSYPKMVLPFNLSLLQNELIPESFLVERYSSQFTMASKNNVISDLLKKDDFIAFLCARDIEPVYCMARKKIDLYCFKS